MKEKSPIVNVIPAGDTVYGVYPLGLYLPKIYEYHLKTMSPLEIDSESGTLNVPLEELFKFLEDNGGKKVYSNSGYEYVFSWDTSMIKITFTEKSKHISAAGYITDPKLMEVFKEVNKRFITKEVKNLIFTIVKTPSGFELKSMGASASIPLIKENYNPEVISNLEFVIDSFKKNPPPSRICILNGDPGTGKTHLIKSLLSQIDNVFIILPSNLISNLDKPEFMPFLLRVKADYEKPIIMVIEDGDACLVPRKSDNMSTIASLLNLSDGILGSIVDIKMIITTNSYIKEIDEAILRPGRLCKNISVDPLPYDLANNVYQRLMADDKVVLEYKKFFTLAEIYAKFNNKDAPGTVVETIKYKSIGFHTHVPSISKAAVLNKEMKSK